TRKLPVSACEHIFTACPVVIASPLPVPHLFVVIALPLPLPLLFEVLELALLPQRSVNERGQPVTQAREVPEILRLPRLPLEAEEVGEQDDVVACAEPRLGRSRCALELAQVELDEPLRLSVLGDRRADELAGEDAVASTVVCLRLALRVRSGPAGVGRLR